MMTTEMIAKSASLSPAIDAEILSRITQFLGYEALLLDENRLSEWVTLLAPEIIYEVPMRLSVKRGEAGEFPTDAFRVRDDLPMILKRLERTTTSENWSEDPPSRTVRNIGGIFVEVTDQADYFTVHSTMIVFRQRALDVARDLIPARRRDLIRVEVDRCILCRRTIILAETILQTPNLGIFL